MSTVLNIIFIKKSILTFVYLFCIFLIISVYNFEYAKFANLIQRLSEDAFLVKYLDSSNLYHPDKQRHTGNEESLVKVQLGLLNIVSKLFAIYGPILFNNISDLSAPKRTRF